MNISRFDGTVVTHVFKAESCITHKQRDCQTWYM